MSATAYALCERVTATPTSSVHIRVIGPEGLKTSGGASDTTLCGAVLNHGWDLTTPVTEDLVLHDLARRPETNPLCVRCGNTYLAVLSDTRQEEAQ